jgi:hypothetical protein
MEWVSALGRYAQRFHGVVGSGHHAASPLAAWLLLALAARAATPARGAELAEVLGVDSGVAADVASGLLDQPHPLVAAGSAVWHRDDVDLTGLAGWRAGLPAATTFGPLPDQAGLDRWAREHTFGLIEAFPIKLSQEVVLALATALATRVSWREPFDVAPAAALGGGSAWASQLTTVLRTPEEGHISFAARSRHAGDVIVHVASTDWRSEQGDATAGLHAVSVAADADVHPQRVLAAAYELGPSAALDPRQPARVSLFDLPLGESPLWTIREERVVGYHRERCGAVLPCWSAKSDHDLAAPELGFAAVTEILAPMLGVVGDAFRARQAAMARYDRYGFEAAAVTGHFEIESVPPEVMARVAELRFGHPYAVVAVTSQHVVPAGCEYPEPGPWHGVPVFSAWVSQPEDPSDTGDPPEATTPGAG